MTASFFISIEGIDGAGKSSLIDYLVDYLNHDKIIFVREPGGTDISEKVRNLLLDVKNEDILPKTEAMLYASARTQLVEEVIRPSLQRGYIVIADRFIDSTMAYQGFARGLDLDFLRRLNSLSTDDLKPDLTLLLDLAPQIGQERKQMAQGQLDRLEKEGISFQEKVRQGYLQLAQSEPQRIKVLDASLPLAQLGEQAISLIEESWK